MQFILCCNAIMDGKFSCGFRFGCPGIPPAAPLRNSENHRGCRAKGAGNPKRGDANPFFGRVTDGRRNQTVRPIIHDGRRSGKGEGCLSKMAEDHVDGFATHVWIFFSSIREASFMRRLLVRNALLYTVIEGLDAHRAFRTVLASSVPASRFLPWILEIPRKKGIRNLQAIKFQERHLSDPCGKNIYIFFTLQLYKKSIILGGKRKTYPLITRLIWYIL